MRTLRPSSYIERSLFDYMKEFVELKFLIDFKDIEIMTEHRNRKKRLEYNRIRNFKKETLDRIYEEKKKSFIYGSITFNIPISRPLFDTIEKSFLDTRLYFDKVFDRFKDTEKDITAEMIKNGFIPNINAYTTFNVKIFTYNLLLHMPLIGMMTEFNEYFFRIYCQLNDFR